MKRRLSKYNVILLILSGILVGMVIAGKMTQKENAFVHVGIAVYNMDDVYMNHYIEQLQTKLDQYENFRKKVLYEILDAEGDWNRQQKQLQYMYSQNFDVLFLNLVKPASAASILNEAADLQIPVILFNRETEVKNLTIAEDIWYVGTDAKAAGAIQGKMLTKLWKEQKEEVDCNKNGKLDYVLVEGEETHFDAIRRTNGFLENSSEIHLNQLKNISVDWKRVYAHDEFSQLNQEVIQTAEAVVCHNDDMALGIYDYYKENQMDIPVILGINNNSEMSENIKSGEIYGTVDNDIEEQVEYMCNLLDGVLKEKTNDFEKIWYSKPQAVIRQ